MAETVDERIIRLETEINGLLKARVAELTQKLQVMSAQLVERKEKDEQIYALEEQLRERDNEIVRLRRETGILQRRLNQLQTPPKPSI